MTGAGACLNVCRLAAVRGFWPWSAPAADAYGNGASALHLAPTITPLTVSTAASSLSLPSGLQPQAAHLEQSPTQVSDVHP